MAFVPVVAPPRPLSPRARDLGARLAEVIETFQRQYPGTSAEDIRQAMRLATPAAGDLQKRKLAIVIGLLAALAGGLFVQLAAHGGSLPTRGMPSAAMLAVLVGLLVVLVARKLSR